MSIIKTYIVPHPPLSIKEIGNGEENKIIKTIESYQSISKEISDLKPDTLIISTPHTKLYSNCFNILSDKQLTGSFENFRAPQISFDEENDIELVDEIKKICNSKDFPGKLDDDYNTLDHGTMVPLYFIRQYYNNFKIIVIGISGLSYINHFKMGEIINKAVENIGRKVIYIASGDLSHKLQEYGPYGYLEEGKIYEEKIVKISKEADFTKLLSMNPNLCEKAAVCGHKSFIMMSGAINKKKLKTTFYSHEDITGVGYEILSYTPIEEDNNNDYLNKFYIEEKNRLNNYYKNADQYILLAKQAITEYVKNKKILDIPDSISNELLENRRGLFVSIHKFNNLRGCIGTIYPIEDNIAKEIVRNAISAAVKDSRFDPIEEDELDYLEINVDVLQEPISIKSIDELNPKEYGIIVSSGYKRGVLLPDLENVDKVEDQIRIAMSKANINSDEEIEIEKFKIIRHKSK